MKPSILIVDDDDEMLEYVSSELSEKYTVSQATNGKEALELLKKEAIQLIISDVMMPVMDGFQLCKIVKTTFDYTHIPVILLTAKNTLQSKIEGIELGADAYIEKPFSPKYLQVQIATLLANRDKIKEYFASSPLVHLKSIAHSKADEQFLEDLNKRIYEDLENEALDIDKLAKIMNMSRPTLFRKIKSISNLTPNELIHIARLKRAAEILTEGSHKIYEVAMMVGYSSQNNFTRNFLKQFGMTPSDFQSRK